MRMPRRLAVDSLFKALALILLSVAAGAAQPTTSASGKVVDETGRPVQGARVELLVPGFGDRADLSRVPILLGPCNGADPSRANFGPYQATSGPDGQFRILDVPADCWLSLGISQRGFTVLAENGVLTPPNGGQVALGTFRLPKVPIVAGKVVDSKGNPLAGARVWARSAKDRWLRTMPPGGRPAAVTGPDGRFEIPRFEPGDLEVCWKHLSAVRFTPQPSALNRIVLTPQPPPLTGRVIDDRGLPVAGAKVYLSSFVNPYGLAAEPGVLSEGWPGWHPCSPRPPSNELVTLSDREGRFTFELTGPGTMSVRAEAAGYLGQGAVYSPQSPGKVEIALERGAIVSGRVLTARGLPAAGAEVSISYNTQALTDGEGRYRVVGVKAGDQTMEVRHPSGQARRKLAVARGENRRPDLILDDDEVREIRGRVIDSTGAPVADAVFSIAYPAALKAAAEGVSTAPDGSFRLSFRRGLSGGEPLGITIEKPGYPKKLLRLDPAAAFSAPLEIRLEPGTRLTRLGGHILGFDAERRAEVSVEARQGENSFTSPVTRNGEYRMDGLSPGAWIVTAQDYEQHCAAARITLEPGEKETVLDLTASSSVEVQGMVLAPDGNPVEGAKVTLRNVDKEAPTCVEDFEAKASSSAEGAFRIQVPEGRYSLAADAEGYSPTVLKTPLTVAARPVEGLEIRLEPGSSLSGRLLGLHPGEVAASVSATAGSLSRNGQVSADGTYRFDDLGPGEWSVSVNVDMEGGSIRRYDRVKLEPGQTAATQDLEILGELSLAVRFTSGEEPVLLRMVLWQLNTTDIIGWADLSDAGPYVFSRLPAGRYRLQVQDDGHNRSFERMIDLSSDRELTIDLLKPEDP
jgi:protocatechuate 3,4-dioxygenase beta subunit